METWTKVGSRLGLWFEEMGPVDERTWIENEPIPFHIVNVLLLGVEVEMGAFLLVLLAVMVW